jgi:small subunit ribosomal protein S13
MLRLVGIDLPENKRIEVALTYVYGIGPKIAKSLLNTCKIDPDMRAKNLKAEDVAKLQKAIESFKVEGDLRKEVRENIQRLRRVGSYRGSRHAAGLPVRGQRTRTNARTLRGKRKTIGAMKKEDAAKVGGAK